MYPDFLGIYRVDGKVMLRLFDPHANYHDGQSRTKWLGMATYLRAESNIAIDEAYAVIVDSADELLAVDLGDDEVVEMLRDANIDLDTKVFGGAKGFALE